MLLKRVRTTSANMLTIDGVRAGPQSSMTKRDTTRPISDQRAIDVGNLICSRRKMSKVQILRSLVNKRLSAAAEEIFELFERTIAEYEEEILRSREEKQGANRQPDFVFNPEVDLHTSDVQQLQVKEEEVLPELRECSPSLNEENPAGPVLIKEEQEDLWTHEEGEQLQELEEADVSTFMFTPVPVKREEDDEEEPQSFHFSQTEENRHEMDLKIEADEEDCEGLESDRDFNEDRNEMPMMQHMISHSSAILGCDWEVTGESQSRLNCFQVDAEPVSDLNCNTGNLTDNSSECPLSFGQIGHKRNETKVKVSRCSICGKRFSERDSLKNHMKLHSDQKRFSCSVCKKKFHWKKDILTHMRTHTGEKPYSCSLCGKSFTQSPHLATHLKVHTGEKPFTCLVCKASFRIKKALAGHMRIHTGEKPFSCPVCGRRFTQKGHMRRHLMVHSGEKPFVCSVCGKGFTQNVSLKKHSIIHTGAKPFDCNVCGKKFTRPEYLRRHKCVGGTDKLSCRDDC